jgi:LacI family transcriptional regulator
MAVTRRDVARQAHVSTATVSNVVNGHGAVGQEVRQRVLDVIRDLGYQPNQIARSLKTKQTNEIALFSSDIMNPYYAEVACGVEEYAREQGYLVCIVTTDLMEKHKTSFFNRQFDGIIVQSIHISVSDLARLTERHIPIVLISGSESWAGLPGQVTQLTIEIKKGARNLFEYMIRQGHQRMAFIASQVLEGTRTNDTRLEAYQEILAAYGVTFDPALVYMEELTPDTIYQYVQSILSIDDPPTAIFTGNDNYALAVLAAVHDLGLSVPRDVSVVGFDNILPAAYYYPPLTTVGIPKYSLGRTAAELLLRKIHGEAVADESIGTELIIRSSVASRVCESE